MVHSTIRHQRIAITKVGCCFQETSDNTDMDFVQDIELQRHCCCLCYKIGRIKVWAHEPGRAEDVFYIYGISNALKVYNELSDVLCHGDFRAFRAARGTL